MDDKSNELLTFFKAMADANRLKIVGLLAQGSYSVEQIAELLSIKPSTVSHHLSKLAKAGLVSARSESYYNMYQLETKVLENTAKRLLARDTLPAVAADVDMDAYDKKVINTFCEANGRIKQFPAQQKKFEVILRYVVKDFLPGRRYSENQVNEMLLRFSDDVASLRRGLVEYKFLAREGGGGEYWLIDK
jgi:DNA-binding HxlR family transcriptional regulator